MVGLYVLKRSDITSAASVSEVGKSIPAPPACVSAQFCWARAEIDCSTSSISKPIAGSGLESGSNSRDLASAKNWAARCDPVAVGPPATAPNPAAVSTAFRISSYFPPSSIILGSNSARAIILVQTDPPSSIPSDIPSIAVALSVPNRPPSLPFPTNAAINLSAGIPNRPNVPSNTPQPSPCKVMVDVAVWIASSSVCPLFNAASLTSAHPSPIIPPAVSAIFKTVFAPRAPYNPHFVAAASISSVEASVARFIPSFADNTPFEPHLTALKAPPLTTNSGISCRSSLSTKPLSTTLLPSPPSITAFPATPSFFRRPSASPNSL